MTHIDPTLDSLDELKSLKRLLEQEINKGLYNYPYTEDVPAEYPYDENAKGNDIDLDVVSELLDKVSELERRIVELEDQKKENISRQEYLDLLKWCIDRSSGKITSSSQVLAPKLLDWINEEMEKYDKRG